LELGSLLAARVVLALEQNELSRARLAAHLGHKTISGELKKQIQRLKEAGLIAYTLPEKPNSRLQQYRLTDTGKTKLEEIKNRRSVS
jgi:ATP-dependent DNA helicase RecG